jgi:hypothetical protein
MRFTERETTSTIGMENLRARARVSCATRADRHEGGKELRKSTAAAGDLANFAQAGVELLVFDSKDV